MKIIVLGGTRFFGRLLVEKLINEGHEVTILTRGNTDDDFGPRVGRIIADRSNASQLKAKLKDRSFDIVYDQICYSDRDALITGEIFSQKINKYIFTSSMYVYEEKEYGLIEEDFNPYYYSYDCDESDKLSYREGKRRAEAQFFQGSPFPCVAVRFPIVMGAMDYTGKFQFHIYRILRNQPNYFSYDNGRMNYINAEEAAEFLSWLKDIDYSGPLNAASPEALCPCEIVEKIGGILNKKIIILQKDKTVIPSAEISPFERKGNMVVDTTKANNLGYTFSSFYSWFNKEVKSVAEDFQG